MKLSRAGWNNVIIFSVMIIILMINATNNKLFPDEDSKNKAEASILPEHSVILTLSFEFPLDQHVLFERIGRGWKLTTTGMVLSKSEQKVDQMMFAWQQSSGLIQAADIVIDNKQGIIVKADLAGNDTTNVFTLYPLNDQLLLFRHQDNVWLALPAALSQQLLP